MNLEIDSIFTREKRMESEKILAELGIGWQISLYGGVEHGFAVKGDLTKKHIKFATDQAFEQAIAWFKFWL
jgi:dienelactone hydrolase